MKTNTEMNNTKTADKIRIDHLPFSIEIYETPDLTNLLAPSNLIGSVKIGEGEPRSSALGRCMIVSGINILNRIQEVE